MQQSWVKGKVSQLFFLGGGEVGKEEAPLQVAPNGGVQESASSSALRISRENLLADLETP